MDDILKIGALIILVCCAGAFMNVDWQLILTGEPSQIIIENEKGLNIDDVLFLNVSSVDWGTIEPGSYTKTGVLLTNIYENKTQVFMSLGDVEPANFRDYLSLSWNLDGAILEPGESAEAEICLYCFSELRNHLVQNITDFNVKIVITILYD